MPLFLLAAALFSQTAYSASSKGDIEQDFTVYQSEMDNTITNLLVSMQNDMETFYNAMRQDAKTDISGLEKRMDKNMKELIAKLDAMYANLKTPEVKRYNRGLLKFLEIQYKFNKDLFTAYKSKKRELKESDLLTITKKYVKELESLKKETIEALQAIGNILELNDGGAGNPK